MLITVSIVLTLTGSGWAGTATELPVSISAWECSGGTSSGMEWTGAKIDVQEERVRFVEVVIRFGSSELPPDEAKWFERPKATPVVDLVAWEQFCRDDCRDDILRELFPEGSSPLVTRATAGRRCRERVSIDVDGTRTSQVALEVIAMTFTSGWSGLIVNPWFDPATVACANDPFAGQAPENSAWADERYDLERGRVKRHGAADGPSADESMSDIQESAGDLLDRLLEQLAARRPDPGTLVSGPPAVRLAAYEARDLATVCALSEDGSGDGSSSYPGEFALSAAVLTDNVVRSMAAVEARFGRNARDGELAIRLLGDGPAPDQREAILEILNSGVTHGDTVTASLALRALLKADPREARRRAEPLLEHDQLWRSACGVFVLSDPALARGLEGRTEITLDVRDEILAYLASKDVQ
jgi:hypothetical protein